MNQTKLPGFAPPPVSRCRVCRKRLTDPDSIAAGIGPKCAAAINYMRAIGFGVREPMVVEEESEQEFLERMDLWNCEGDDDSYPCIKMGDINRLLGIIRRLKSGITRV